MGTCATAGYNGGDLKDERTVSSQTRNVLGGAGYLLRNFTKRCLEKKKIIEKSHKHKPLWLGHRTENKYNPITT